MNPSFNPKLARVYSADLRGRMGLIVGFGTFNGRDVVFRKASAARADIIDPTKTYMNNIATVKCWNCGVVLKDAVNVGILVANYLDMQGAWVIGAEVEGPLESFQYCTKCSDDHQNKMAKIICNSCGKVVAYSEKGKMPSGFEIKDGMTLHTDHCPSCLPGLMEIKILEDTCQLSSTSSTTPLPKAHTYMDDPPQVKPV